METKGKYLFTPPISLDWPHKLNSEVIEILFDNDCKITGLTVRFWNDDIKFTHRY